MKLLALGGTGFVGRHVVEAAMAGGHDVTLFNRGQRNPELFPELDRLRGDRAGDLSALEGRRWDAVVDTSGLVPSVVRATARLLAPAVGHYTLFSTVYVYADQTRRDLDESAPVGLPSGPIDETVAWDTAGPLKALSEREVEVALPGRALVLRCGMLVGPHDLNGRFTYWARRLAAGGEVLAPGSPDTVFHAIDARDMAEWLVRAIEAGTTGTFNVAGPERPLTMGAFLEACREVVGTDARLTWVSADFLNGQDLTPAERMALFPGERGASAGSTAPPEARAMATMDIRKAVQAGLTLRPLAETVRDTLAWHRAQRAGVEYRANLESARERALLQAWHARATDARG